LKKLLLPGNQHAKGLRNHHLRDDRERYKLAAADAEEQKDEAESIEIERRRRHTNTIAPRHAQHSVRGSSHCHAKLYLQNRPSSVGIL
jgi:hypothetical protein